MANKIDIYGGLTPVLDATAGQRSASLAGLFNALGQHQFKKEAGQKQKEGELAGLNSVKRNEEGALIAPELKDDNTFFGEAFNKGALLAHKAALDIDVKHSLDDAQLEFKDDPQGFALKSKAIKDGLLESMPPELAARAGIDIDQNIANRLGGIKLEFHKKEKERQKGVFTEGLETLSDDISNAARSGDEKQLALLTIKSTDRILQAIEAELITPAQAEAMQEELREVSVQQAALGEIDRVIFNSELSLEEQVKKGVDFLDNLRKKPPSDLNAQQNEALRNVIEAKVSGLQEQLLKEKSTISLETARDISNLEVAINSGVGEPDKLAEMVEGYFNKGQITPAKRTSLLTELMNKKKESGQKAIDYTKVASKLFDDNPGVVVSKKMADGYYNEVYSEQIENLPPEEKAAYQANFIEKVRVVPTAIKDELQNAVMSRDQELIKVAADIIDRVDHIPGLPDLALTANDRAFIENINSLARNMAPEQAIDIALKNTDPNDKARIEARQNEIKSEKMEVGSFTSDGYKDIVNDAFEGFFGGDRLLKNINLEQMTAEYKEIFEAHYIAGTNKERAQEITLSQLQANWKESEFGFMRNPPEDFYTVAGDASYIRKQLISDINKEFIGLDFDSKNVFLQSDDVTARLASTGKPDYKVLVLDNNGQLNKLVGRWSPDRALQEEKVLKENEKKANLLRIKPSFTPEASLKAREAANAIR